MSRVPTDSARAAPPLPGGLVDTRAALRGKRLGLICSTSQSDTAQLFLRAAASLGAQVAVVDAAKLLEGMDAERLGHLLARLYDAVECQGLPAPLVQRLADCMSIPLFDDLAGRSLGGEPAGGQDQALTRMCAALLRAL